MHAHRVFKKLTQKVWIYAPDFESAYKMLADLGKTSGWPIKPCPDTLRSRVFALNPLWVKDNLLSKGWEIVQQNYGDNLIDQRCVFTALYACSNMSDRALL